MKRYEQYNDFVKARNDWREFCKEANGDRGCAVCEYLDKFPHCETAGCFAHWLMVEIPTSSKMEQVERNGDCETCKYYNTEVCGECFKSMGESKYEPYIPKENADEANRR